MSDKFFDPKEREIDHIKKPVCDFARGTGWYVDQVAALGRNGFPDTFVARNGVIMLLEFKAPGKEPTPQQAKRHRELRDHGVPVYVVDNVEYGRELLR